MLKQLTVFLENRKGSLIEMTDLLKEANIDIITFTIAETENYGLMRMVVNKPEEAEKLLKDNDFSASLTDVVVVEIPAEPGSLNELIKKIENFNIEYLYVYSNRDDISGIVLRIKEGQEAEKIITQAGYDLVEDYSI